MTITLSDTLSKGYLKLDPKTNPEIKIYVCGVTVYDFSHVGHARVFIVFDVLRRLLIKKGFKVKYVQNFTDIDDKIINKAKESGVSYKEVSENFIKAYLEDSDALNLLRADLYPRATEHIADMVEFIQGLLNKGHAYLSTDGIYYDVSSFKEYGKLSKIKKEELIAGARIEANENKRNPLDFALWKFYDQEPYFETVFGKGRPGWHIECSTMIRKNLGETIDIHGGGEDLIFPHHENEIAQSEGLNEKPLAKIWMHVGLVKFGKEKMSKSLHNVIYIRDFLRNYGPNTLRVFALSSHYRSQLEFSEEKIKEAVESWKAIEDAEYSLLQPFNINYDTDVSDIINEIDLAIKDLENDLDTPAALNRMLRASKKINQMWASLKISKEISEKLKPFQDLFNLFGFRLKEVSASERENIEKLIVQRNKLREEKKFKDADEIRKSLLGFNIKLIDTPQGTFWRKVEVL
ncbi:MAG: cysteine--tRNA ligase [Nitrososphaeria archaeon]|nr:cysteine--tRNA ligase [Conexivisphaerales archaeon]